MRTMSAERGWSLAELLVVIAVIGLSVGAALPAFDRMRAKADARATIQLVRNQLHLARARAAATARATAIRFAQIDGEWQLELYEDRNGNGVRTAEIRRGVDRLVGRPRRLRAIGGTATLRIPYAVRSPEGERMHPATSPVRFGASRMCSFSPIGESSSGSLYVTSRLGDLYAVRVLGGSGRIRVQRYDSGTAAWSR